MSPSALRVALTLVLVAGGATVTTRPAGAQPSKNQQVLVLDSGFQQAAAEIYLNGRIVWSASSDRKLEHSLTFENGTVDLDIPPGDVNIVSRPFTRTGSYAYYCKYQGGKGGQGMAGTITVVEDAPTTTTAPPTSTTTAPPTTTTTAPPTTTTTAPPTTTTTPPTTTTTAPPTTTTTAPPTTTTTWPAPIPTTADPPPPSVTGAVASPPPATPRQSSGAGAARDPKPLKPAKPPKAAATTPSTTTNTVVLPPLDLDLPTKLGTSPTTTTTALDGARDEVAAPRRGDKDGGLPIVPIGAGLLALALGGIGWAFHHRSSRYLPA